MSSRCRNTRASWSRVASPCRRSRGTHFTGCLTTIGELITLGNLEWANHNDGFVNICASRNYL